MTNKEAITILNMVEAHGSLVIKAKDIAIKALEQEPKIGHWIAYPKGIYAHLVCDKCLSNAPYDCRTNYCPNCGARMFEEQESEEISDHNLKMWHDIYAEEKEMIIDVCSPHKEA